MESLVSIIIPTYNRAHLIGETLNSIISQTYTNWECIIIDDGSTDNTYELVVKYCLKDHRIQCIRRPENIAKGANACRNYGFERSIGFYTKWFDSDDIMLPDHLETLITTLETKNVDFVVGDCIYFEIGKLIDRKLYEFDKNNVEMDALMFAKSQIGWITDDFLAKRSTLINFKFNEKLEDGQEYNLFIRYLLTNKKGVFINKIVTRARIHSQSLGTINKIDQLNHKKILAKIKMFTLEDVFKYKHEPLNDWFISGYIYLAHLIALERSMPPSMLKGFVYIVKIKNLTKAFVFLLSMVTLYFFKKGYILNKYSRN